MIQPGDVAPDFALPDADMDVFELSAEHSRRHVVVYFYPRDKTPGCTIQAEEFSDLEMDFARHDCVVVGISPDDCVTHAEFRDNHGLSVRLLSDEDREVCEVYGVCQQRVVDGVERNCITRTTFIIDKTGLVRHILADVSPRGHAAEVLSLIKQL